MNILILGSAEHGKVVKETAVFMGMYDRIAFLDDNAENAIGGLNEYETLREEFECAFAALNDSEIRRKYTEQLRSSGYIIPTLVHPEAYVSSSARVSAGTIVMPGAIVQANSRIGKGCIISAGAIIDYDVTIGDYCRINAGAIVPSGSILPENTTVDYGEIWRV